MQPDRLKEALAGADDGLAARFVYVWPEQPPILPLPIEPDAAARGRRERLTNAALRLFGLPMDGDLAGDPAPRLLPLDRDAFALFDELRQETAMSAARDAAGEMAKTAKTEIWLPFLNAYRTMCIAPSPDFLLALEGISALRIAAELLDRGRRTAGVGREADTADGGRADAGSDLVGEIPVESLGRKGAHHSHCEPETGLRA